MAVYRVRNKAHTRITTREEPAVDSRGNPYIVVHAGETQRFEVGSLVSDLTLDELAAFPDRFELIDGTPLAPIAQAAPRAVLHPDVMALVRRAHDGTATEDEQLIVGDILVFLDTYMAGAQTEAQEQAMSTALGEFGISLWKDGKVS